jgi:hypothetical protein
MRKAETAATEYFLYALIERYTLIEVIEAFFTPASNPSIGR